MNDGNAAERPRTTGELAALLFAMVFPSFMSWMEFEVLGSGGQTMPGKMQAEMQSVFFFGKAIQFTFPLLFVLAVARERLDLAWPTSRGVLTGAAFALIVAAGMFTLYFGFLRGTDLLGDTPAKISDWLRKIKCNSPTGYLLMATFVSIPHSFLEEYYWRWFVFGRLRHHVSVSMAVALSSLAFMGHHVVVLSFYFPGKFWIGALPFSLCVAVGGAVWAWLYQRSNNLYAPFFSHLLVDAAIMVVGYDLICFCWQ